MPRSLPIPRYDVTITLHRELTAAAHFAEGIAATVALPPGGHFVRARSLVREALLPQGIAQTIEGLVVRLLAGTD